MGGNACSGKRDGDDGYDSVDWRNFAILVLWWNKYFSRLDCNGFRFATFMLYW